MKISFHPQHLSVKDKVGTDFVFNDCTLTGELLFLESDGPFGIREFESPSFLDVQFNFEHQGNEYQYEGLLTSFGLIPAKEVIAGDVASTSNSLSPVIQAVVDTRNDLQIVRDENIESLRLKYSDSRFQLFELNGNIWVRWNLFNQNISGYEIVHFKIDIEKLLFLNATKLYFDDSGSIEDYDPHGEDFSNIRRLEPVE